MRKMRKIIVKCCFCNCKIDNGKWHSTEPLKTYPWVCCERCQIEKVIPERIRLMKGEK